MPPLNEESNRPHDPSAPPLSGLQGREYWRGFEERLAADARLREFVSRGLPEHACQWPDALSRREFLALMGASLALAGLDGCTSVQMPVGRILPYVRQPEEMAKGQPLYFATAMNCGGPAVGLIVKSHEGRPTKIEGNPDHPASLGATDAFAQAAVLGLFDPDRSQAVTCNGQARGRGEALEAVRRALRNLKDRDGRGLRILTETVVSPTLFDQIAGDRKGSLLHEFPKARWHQYEPLQSAGVLEGSKLAFGRYVDTIYDFSAAETVVSLDADFFTFPGSGVRYAHDFMGRRRAAIIAGGRMSNLAMNRLYVAECVPSITGAKADHRLPVRAGEIAALVENLVADLGLAATNPAALSDERRRWLEIICKEIKTHPKASVVIAGPGQPPEVHAYAHWINMQLGNEGAIVRHVDPVAARPADQMVDLRKLVDEMRAGQAEMLLILGGNPVHNSPADIDFAAALSKVPASVHLGLYYDETAAGCRWHFPAAHFLEAWSDARAFDGTASIVQPLIGPLYQGISTHELLAALVGDVETPGYEIVRDYWRQRWPGTREDKDFEHNWAQALHDGKIGDTQFPPIKDLTANRPTGKAPSAEPSALEIIFQCDPTIYDGRFANNGWLQELPKPITRLTWDNAVLMGPALAAKLGFAQSFGDAGGEHGQMLVERAEVEIAGRSIEGPVFILPGHADNAISVQLGYGRSRAGRVGTDVGFDANRIRTSDSPWFAWGAAVRKIEGGYTLACVQMHHAMEGRDTVREGTFGELVHGKLPAILFESSEQKRYQLELVPRATADESASSGAKEPAAADPRLKPLTLYQSPAAEPPRNRWGMSIDLTSCIGCGACVMACQAENNSPVVGKVEVTRGREMHWIRIDRYYRGDAGNPATSFQPVPCMQCENAPCELVCPVGATVHSADGLNDMVYNRCVGTRYCSNNCPYKVRRFNFFQFGDFTTESYKAGRNPEVTVRGRGVMEKCTYCVQRIRAAQVQAEIRGENICDGDVVTACQQACPAEAIVFGDLNDPQSEVSKRKTEQLNYGLLAELNTRPRTTYLAVVRNPNSELK